MGGNRSMGQAYTPRFPTNYRTFAPNEIVNHDNSTPVLSFGALSKMSSSPYRNIGPVASLLGGETSFPSNQKAKLSARSCCDARNQLPTHMLLARSLG